MTDNKSVSQEKKAIVNEINDEKAQLPHEAAKPQVNKKASKQTNINQENQAIIKEAFDAQLSDEEAKKVIDAVEPLIQQNQNVLKQ